MYVVAMRVIERRGWVFFGGGSCGEVCGGLYVWGGARQQSAGQAFRADRAGGVGWGGRQKEVCVGAADRGAAGQGLHPGAGQHPPQRLRQPRSGHAACEVSMGAGSDDAARKAGGGK
jgi:hypothetical protein